MGHEAEIEVRPDGPGGHETEEGQQAIQFSIVLGTQHRIPIAPPRARSPRGGEIEGACGSTVRCHPARSLPTHTTVLPLICLSRTSGSIHAHRSTTNQPREPDRLVEETANEATPQRLAREDRNRDQPHTARRDLVRPTPAEHTSLYSTTPGDRFHFKDLVRGHGLAFHYRQGVGRAKAYLPDRQARCGGSRGSPWAATGPRPHVRLEHCTTQGNVSTSRTCSWDHGAQSTARATQPGRHHTPTNQPRQPSNRGGRGRCGSHGLRRVTITAARTRLPADMVGKEGMAW